jgi:hypothetical protein
MSQRISRRSASAPNSGWMIEEPTVIASTSAPAAAYDQPRWMTKNGSSAGTAPWHRSAAAWPQDSRASRPRSISPVMA